MNKPLVSVVMITYGHETYIQQAVYSILQQEGHFDLEIIVCDDASPDGTHEIIAEIIKTHPKGHLISYFRHTKNIGFNRNFKYALNLASGQFVALCEGDDFWTNPKKLEIQINFLNSYPDYYFCMSLCELKDETTQKISKQDKYEGISFPHQITFENFLNPYILDTNTLVYRNNLNLKSVAQRGFKDIVLYALLLNEGKGVMLGEYLGCYRIHAQGNWTSKTLNEKYLENLTSAKLLFQIFKNGNKPITQFIKISIESLIYTRDKKINSFFFNMSILFFYFRVNKDKPLKSRINYVISAFKHKS
jgi:glycosyltransferase involved in cell wall biosynthesis